MRLLQLVQITVGTRDTLRFELEHAQSVKRIGLLRINQQQFFPDLSGPDRVVLCLPELPLLQQRLACVAELGIATALNQGCEYPEGYGVTAR